MNLAERLLITLYAMGLLNLFAAEAYTICLIHKAVLQVFQMPIRPKARFCLQKFAAFLFLRIIDL
jgi:hypothetical protein